MEKTVEEKVNIYVKLIQVSNQIGQFENSYKYAKSAYQLLNFSFNFNPNLLSILFRLFRIELKIKRYNLDELKKINIDKDLRRSLIASISANLTPAAYKNGKRLLMINGILTSNEHIFDYGISLNTIIGIFGLSIIFSSEKIANYAIAVKSGRFGNYLLQEYPNAPAAGYCKFVYANFAARWERPLRDIFALFKIASRESLSQGNIAMGITSLYCLLQTELLAGAPLNTILKEAEVYGQEAKKLSAFTEDKCLSVYRDVARALSGEIKNPFESIPIEFADDLKDYNDLTIYPINFGHYQLWKTILRYLFDQYDEVKKVSELPSLIMENYAGLQSTAMLLLTTSLSLAALMVSYKDNPGSWKLIKKYYKTIKSMADAIPINYGPYAWMIEGEMARLKGENDKAIDLYQQSINMARQEENPFLLGIAYELTARFYIKVRSQELTTYYLRKALRCFEAFHAHAKAEHLKAHYKEYFEEEETYQESKLSDYTTATYHTMVTSTHTTTSDDINIDLETVIQASQSLSKEIDINKLMEALMHLMVVSAGANRAVLIRFIDNEPYIYSEIESSSSYQHLEDPVPLNSKGKEVCINIIKYAIRTKSQVLLNNVEEDSGSFQNDPYFLWSKPKSILCFPLMQTTSLKGVLYLENTTSSNAFTPSHLQLLTILSSQMVISLENAEFYGNLEDKVSKRTQELNQKNNELLESNKQLQIAFKHIQEVHDRMIQQEKWPLWGCLQQGLHMSSKTP